LPESSRFTGIVRKLLTSTITSAAMHVAASVDRKIDAAATESDTPVPSAM
jgi:hypothetical protein